MTSRAATCSMLLGLAALLPAASGCGARSELATGHSEPSFRCANGSRAGAVGCGRVAFADRVEYPVAPGLDKVVIADVNGDGALDLVVAGESDAVTVLLNLGHGVFAGGVTYPTSLAGASSVAAGDLNQDGAVDLVVGSALHDGTSVSVLLNDGHGAFAPGVLYAAGIYPRSVALGDLDGDGLLDIATANGASDDVSVLSNLGDGTFGPPVTHGSLDNPSSIAVVDLDGDGRLDLVATFTPVNGWTSFNIGFFRNAGGGTFDDPILQPGFGGHAVAVGDADGDGWPDLASATSLVTGTDYLNGLGVRLNRGDGTFGDPALHQDVGDLDSLAMADLNGDCRPDIALTGQDGHVGVLPNLGDGTFGPTDLHAVAKWSWSLAAGDLDGDGKVDLAVTSDSPGMVSVLLNRGCAP